MLNLTYMSNKVIFSLLHIVLWTMNFLFEKCSSFNLGFVLTTTTVSHSYSVNDRKPSGAKYKEMDYCKQSFKSLCVNVRVLCMHLDLPKRQNETDVFKWSLIMESLKEKDLLNNHFTMRQPLVMSIYKLCSPQSPPLPLSF